MPSIVLPIEVKFHFFDLKYNLDYFYFFKKKWIDFYIYKKNENICIQIFLKKCKEIELN